VQLEVRRPSPSNPTIGVRSPDPILGKSRNYGFVYLCAPKNRIDYIIIILTFVNLSLRENVIISVFILKVPILQPYGNNSSGWFFYFCELFLARMAIICRKMWEKWAIIWKEYLATPGHKSKHGSTKRRGWLEWHSHGLPTSMRANVVASVCLCVRHRHSRIAAMAVG
jgi:hypothetical protein